ncbi:uncharacterized protein LOC110253054 isoform X2 [Exaiptasia diaphana]|uniref:Death domain-containing protein n=1 Tax=Exaiptasia diaphana TaxID=2652724 RepID=A0A913Y7X2_EXADI|nr:uncharacterized protein LOC110253054 isoform X2 [Exaiptasia diaphana]
MAEKAPTQRGSFASSDSAISNGEDSTQDVLTLDFTDMQLQGNQKEMSSFQYRERTVPVDKQDLLSRYLNQRITENECHRITSDERERLGPDWKKLGRELEFPEALIISFSQHENNEERAHAMLVAFRQRQAKQATRKRLIAALNKIGRNDLTEKLLGYEQSQQKQIEGLYHEKTLGELIVCIKDGQRFVLYPVGGTEFERDFEAIQNSASHNVNSALSRAHRILTTETLTSEDEVGKQNRTQSESIRRPPREIDNTWRPNSAIDPLCSVNHQESTLAEHDDSSPHPPLSSQDGQ